VLELIVDTDVEAPLDADVDMDVEPALDADVEIDAEPRLMPEEELPPLVDAERELAPPPAPSAASAPVASIPVLAPQAAPATSARTRVTERARCIVGASLSQRDERDPLVAEITE
jgi:hypothetical protein